MSASRFRMVPLLLLVTLACSSRGAVADHTSNSATHSAQAPGLQAAAVAAAPAAGSELLLNPSFETGSNSVSDNGGKITGFLPDGWADNTEWATPQVSLTYSISTQQQRSGSRSACVKVARGGFAQFGQYIEALPAGLSYNLSTWAKAVSIRNTSNPTATNSKVPVRIGLQLAAEPYTMFAQSELLLSVSDGWVQLKLPDAAVPPSSSGVVPVLFLMWVGQQGSSTAAEVCVDDGSMKEVQQGGDTTANELLANPSFDGAAATFTSNVGNISGSMPQGWNDNTEWAGPEIALQYSVVPQPVHGGSSSLRIDVNGGFAQFTQWLELPPAEAYRLSLWARAQPKAAAAAAAAGEADSAGAGAGSELATTAAATGGLAVTLGLRLMNPPYTMFDSISANVGSSWTQLVLPAAVIPATAVANPGQNISVGFMVSASGLGRLWLDDASLTLVDELPEVTVITKRAAVVTRRYFCMNVNHLGGRAGDRKPGYAWPAVDFGLFRTWDSGNTWASIQPAGRSQFDWSAMDKDAAQARIKGQKILFTLGQSPTWASSQPQLPSVYGDGRGSPPSSRQAWKAFVRALLARYRGLIYALEVWNEPNLQGPEGFYNGTPEQLAQLAKATAEVLAEPRFSSLSVLLLNPPMAGLAADAVDFLTKYFVESKRLGVVHTGVAWHSYNLPAELDIKSMETMRGLLASPALGLSPNLPVFNTEAGILQDAFAALGNNHTYGAGFLARTFVLNWALGVQHCCWYAFDADTMEGLTMSTPEQQDATTLNIAGKAYTRLMSWMIGARIISMKRDTQGVWAAALVRREPGSAAAAAADKLSRFWIVWNGDYRVSSQQFVAPAAWKVSSSQDLLSGAVYSGAAVVVTDVPVLLMQ